jgi:hypothetical protein
MISLRLFDCPISLLTSRALVKGRQPIALADSALAAERGPAAGARDARAVALPMPCAEAPPSCCFTPLGNKSDVATLEQVRWYLI